MPSPSRVSAGIQAVLTRCIPAVSSQKHTEHVLTKFGLYQDVGIVYHRKSVALTVDNKRSRKKTS